MRCVSKGKPGFLLEGNVPVCTDSICPNMASTAAVSFQSSSEIEDSDVHITFEDQQKINKFARQNARLDDLKDELKAKEKELQNLDDATEELMLLEGEDISIPYLLGEVFVCQGVEDTQKMLEAKKARVNEEILAFKNQCEAIKKVMSELKVQLYSKFGNNINLDPEDE